MRRALTGCNVDFQLTRRLKSSLLQQEKDRVAGADTKAPRVTIFDDRMANVTYTSQGAQYWTGQYFEGSNIYVYIHGKDDPQGDWWAPGQGPTASRRTGGVLVNCHFDS